MPKVLYITSHRKDRSPSQRFRFEQYMDFLRDNGFDYHFSSLISEDDDKIFYQPGNLLTKIRVFLKSAYRRWTDVLEENIKHYDIVFIQREAFMTGSTFFEKRFKKSGAKIIFDFDDAIWNFDVSKANKRFGWLKNPGKTAKIINLSDIIFAGNQYLADYALHHNNSVVIIPTTIDMQFYKRVAVQKKDDEITIGWSGSITTIKHFEYAIPFLTKIKSKYGDKVNIKVIGDSQYKNQKLGIQGIAWNRQDELAELSSFDIGIMPLPDDEWAKGKCGLKGLQYMALEIPTIMSPVGVNSEIISDGINGFLAHEVSEWVDKLEILINDADLRMRMGKEAKKTVEVNYSVESHKQTYLRYFNQVLGK